MVADIRFTKGNYSVGVHTDNVSQEYSNKLIVLSIPQTAPNQESGAKEPKILDLLRVTKQFVIKGYLTGTATASSSTNDTETGSTALTAKQVKDNLITIWNGGGTAGGVVTMTYDGDSYTGYIEKVVAVKKARDSPSSESVDEIKYELQITFVVGTTVGS
jgi:hypothetical protein